MSAFRSVGRKIIGIGRNFRDHAKELSNPVPSEPFYFLKPTSSYCPTGKPITIPSQWDIHHEVELGVVIGKPAYQVQEARAMEHIQGYVLGLDLTARDVQKVSKAKGLPWSMAKCFDNATPITDMIPAHALGDPHQVDLWLRINGELRQSGNTKDFVFSIPTLIAHVSRSMTLEEGDFILTGTPAGVGPIRDGDLIEAAIEQQGKRLLHGEWRVQNNAVKN